MQTQRIIYVTLIALLAVSLLIPALSAQVCPECGEVYPCNCTKDGAMVPESPRPPTGVILNAYVAPKSVERPTTNASEKVMLSGSLEPIAPDLELDLGGIPVLIQVLGPSDTSWKAETYTDSDGSFKFNFEILKSAHLGFYDVIVTSAAQTARVSFEVVWTDTEPTTTPPGYDLSDIAIVSAVLGGVVGILLWLWWYLRKLFARALRERTRTRRKPCEEERRRLKQAEAELKKAEDALKKAINDEKKARRKPKEDPSAEDHGRGSGRLIRRDLTLRKRARAKIRRDFRAGKITQEERQKKLDELRRRDTLEKLRREDKARRDRILKKAIKARKEAQRRVKEAKQKVEKAKKELEDCLRRAGTS